ncbi:hypothetical protein KC571_00235 [candidate division WWE3 bacterium]|uniref:DUF5673 domain-containing protein n=1 Tax=candidate division WWE3 bacterium TaxID=2053526 RepID=A0A955RP27_UNCKA|nr:hypothetical protein [candidate division WWE3 bacterium]
MEEETNQTDNKASTKEERKFQKPELLVEWTGPSHVHNAREHNFFVTLFVASIAFGFVLVLFKQYTLMLVNFALAFTIYAANKHEPQWVTYQILNTSLKIDNDEYYYNNLSHFWFEKIGGKDVLKVRTFEGHPDVIELVIRPEDEEQIEDVLLQNVPYQEEKEHRLITFIKKLVLPIHEVESTEQPTEEDEQ